MSENDKLFMMRAIELARKGVDSSGGPFGAVIVKDGRVIGEGFNQVTLTNDPTAHAEIVAIREACRGLGSFQLDGCAVYASCEPCPMCLGAIYWARAERLFIGCTREDAAAAGFDDAFIYEEMGKPAESRGLQASTLLREEALTVFTSWMEKSDKTEY